MSDGATIYVLVTFWIENKKTNTLRKIYLWFLKNWSPCASRRSHYHRPSLGVQTNYVKWYSQCINAALRVTQVLKKSIILCIKRVFLSFRLLVLNFFEGKRLLFLKEVTFVLEVSFSQYKSSLWNPKCKLFKTHSIVNDRSKLVCNQ